MPALATTTSIPPSAETVPATARPSAAWSVTSQAEPAMCRAQVRGQGPETLRLQPHQRQARAARGQHARQRLADPARGPGDQDDLPADRLGHVPSLRLDTVFARTEPLDAARVAPGEVRPDRRRPPGRSRYQLLHPPASQTVPRMRRSTPATKASCASGRGSTVRAPVRAHEAQRAQQVRDLRLEHVHDRRVADAGVRTEQQEEVGEARPRSCPGARAGCPPTPRAACGRHARGCAAASGRSVGRKPVPKMIASTGRSTPSSPTMPRGPDLGDAAGDDLDVGLRERRDSSRRRAGCACSPSCSGGVRRARSAGSRTARHRWTRATSCIAPHRGRVAEEHRRSPRGTRRWRAARAAAAAERAGTAGAARPAIGRSSRGQHPRRRPLEDAEPPHRGLDRGNELDRRRAGADDGHATCPRGRSRGPSGRSGRRVPAKRSSPGSVGTTGALSGPEARTRTGASNGPRDVSMRQRARRVVPGRRPHLVTEAEVRHHAEVVARTAAGSARSPLPRVAGASSRGWARRRASRGATRRRRRSPDTCCRARCRRRRPRARGRRSPSIPSCRRRIAAPSPPKPLPTMATCAGTDAGFPMRTSPIPYTALRVGKNAPRLPLMGGHPPQSLDGPALPSKECA